MSNPIYDALDYGMTTGDGCRIKECPNCIGQGNSKAVQITRKEDGFLWYCFRCRKTGFIRDTNASPKQVQEIAKNAGKKREKYSRPNVVSLPKDFTVAIPPKALVQLYNLRITDDDMQRHDIGWSPDCARIIIPVYKYSKEPGGWAKKLVGHMGRRVDVLGGDESGKPKWSSVRQADVQHPRFISLPTTVRESKTVVIVEDIFSAIRIGANGYMSIALLTTYLPYELYPKLRGWKVHIWLDQDAFSKSAKYQAALGSNGVSALTILTPGDPKTYDDKQILEAISNGRISSKN
jgi:hypothetical protein